MRNLNPDTMTLIPSGEDGVDYTWHPEHTNGVLKKGETESLDSTKRVYFKAPMPKHLISAFVLCTHLFAVHGFL